MSKFLYPVDIANRALDHCGIPPISDFSDDSKAAERTSANYDKLRDAELRRNVWRFAIRKVALRAVDTTTMFLVPAVYDETKTYPQGSIVSWDDGAFYFAAQYVPISTAPATPNEAYWTIYFGPQTVAPYVSTTSYYAGELAYYDVSGAISVYQCLTSGSTDNPTASPTAWASTATYNNGDTVTSGASTWQSLTDLNTGHTPVAGLYWAAVPVANQAATQVGRDWLKINATVRYVRFPYPLGAGPRQQASSRNIFRLPSGFLRQAPHSPKEGATSDLGAPSGLPYDDWDIEGDFITTMDSSVIVLRFVADIQDVGAMDPMFCEGLGARLGLEVCEPLTQSDSKLSTISQVYKTMMSEARAVNGIETGFVEMPVDDYLTVRL